MNECLFGLTLGLIAGAYIVSRSKQVQEFVHDAEATVKKAVKEVNKQIKKA